MSDFKDYVSLFLAGVNTAATVWCAMALTVIYGRMKEDDEE